MGVGAVRRGPKVRGMIRRSALWWRRRWCAAPVSRLPVPTLRMSVGELALRPGRALAALAVGGAVIVVLDGSVLGVLTRDRRVSRDVCLALALQPALPEAAGEGERG